MHAWVINGCGLACVMWLPCSSQCQWDQGCGREFVSLYLVRPSSVLTGTVLGGLSHWEGSRSDLSCRLHDCMTVYKSVTCLRHFARHACMHFCYCWQWCSLGSWSLPRVACNEVVWVGRWSVCVCYGTWHPAWLLMFHHCCFDEVPKSDTPSYLLHVWGTCQTRPKHGIWTDGCWWCVWCSANQMVGDGWHWPTSGTIVWKAWCLVVTMCVGPSVLCGWPQGLQMAKRSCWDQHW